uniref:CSON000342 protein n=1 Tax=Culicoides sonorensis TaxID=179676 RepID=A0A336KVN6_CULSO
MKTLHWFFISIFCQLFYLAHCKTILEQILNLDELDQNFLNITEKCREKIHETKNGVLRKELWGFKLIDASGRHESGFVWGNNYWTSSKELCQVLNEGSTIHLSARYHRNNHANLSSSKPPFSVNYQVVHVRHSSLYQIEQKIYDKNILHIGLCFPSACSSNETALLVEQVFKTNEEEYEIIGKNYTFLTSKVAETSERALSNVFLILTIIGLTIIFLLILIGTIYTKCVRKSFWQDFVLTQDNGIVEANGKNIKIEQNSRKNKNKSFLDDFLTSFSIIDNFEKLYSLKLNQKTLSVIHGLRGIGMVWIISAHIYFFSFGSIDNMQLAMNFAGLVIAQPMLNAAINVDTFFALSGFLLAYSFFQHIKETEGKAAKKPLTILFKGIITRYLRLVIPYIPAFLFTASLAFYLKDVSSYHFIEQNDVNCERYWWRNFLFINNWWPMEEMCMVSSWYLSADFQCFLISILLLTISLRFPKTIFTIFVIMFVSASAYSGYVGWTENFSYMLDVQFNTINTLYYPTHTRIGGYFVGVAAGWIFVRLPKDFIVNKIKVAFGWIFALAITVSLFLAQTFRVENQYLGMFFAGFCRPLWAAAMMWIVIMCSRGYGGFITKLLNAEALIRLSRLSFSAYLINPILIFFVSMISDVPFHLELVSTTITLFGYVYLIYLLAEVFALLFEYPFVQLIKKILNRIENKSHKNKYSTHL